MSNLPAVVVDTNVLFVGLTKQGGAEGFIINAWRLGLIQVYVSDALAYEYVDVLSRKLSSLKWARIQPVLQLLLQKVEFTTIYYSWRPMSPDPGDDLVIDCGMNADAIVITTNIRDFQNAKISLGLEVLSPQDFVDKLINLEGGI
jgi:predicted nucleic acid-binding protein